MSTEKRFAYTALNRKGEKVEGEVEAPSLKQAKLKLQKTGLLSVKCKPITTSFWKKIRSKRIDSAQICAFARQMATLFAAGVPIIKSFEIVSQSTDNPNMQKLVATLRQQVESGDTLAQALKQHPKYFDELFCTLVEVGENSGTLEAMLDRVALYKEKTESLKRKIKKAMFYPSAVILIALVVTAILLIFVVPQFEDLFKSFNAELPAFTRLVIWLSEGVQQWWWIFLMLAAASAYLFIQLKKRSFAFRCFVDRLILKLPIVGKIISKAILSRYARTLSTTFAAGMPLIEALETVSEATGNIVYHNAIKYVHEEVSIGTELNVAMRGAGVFPNLMIQLIGIGEESGTLDSMLTKIADVYEEEVDLTIEGLSSLLEPLIIVILGVLVGGLVIAMYLPIFQMGSVI